MATFDTTYTFTAGTQIPSAEFNTNFSDIESFLNESVVHVDGSKAFTGLPSLPASDPTSDNQPTRKKYVDDRTGVLAKRIHADVTNHSTTTWNDLGISLPDFAMPDLDDNGRILRISLFIPNFAISGTPNVTDRANVRIRTQGGRTVVSGGVGVNTTQLTPDNIGSLYLQRTFYDQTFTTAGSTVSLSVEGQLLLGGNFQAVGDADSPIEFFAEFV